MTPFKFNIGLRVRLTEPGPRHNAQGVVTGQYPAGASHIPRLHDTLVATVPWTENMYTVQLAGTNPEVDDPAVMVESWLALVE